MGANAYSFGDVTCSIQGPNGSFELGSGAGAADEGISVEMIEDKGTMTMGAGGEVMHSLHVSKAGRITVRLLKTSRANQLLQAMYQADTSSSALYGGNTIVIRDVARGDVVVASQVAFQKLPNNAWSKDGNILEWAFNCGEVDMRLGTGTPARI